MPRETEAVLAFVPSALMASQVGTWQSDTIRDQTVADTVTAALFGVDPEEAAAGLPLNAFTRHIHPDDLPEFEDKLEDVRERGGLFVIEYRTCPTCDDIRWVLARGRYEWDPHLSGMIGRGIVIDITDSKLDGQIEDRAFFVAQNASDPSLDRVAALALEARDEIDKLGAHDTSPLRRAVDALLWLIGCSLALQREEGRPSKNRMN